jgi:hypothetical protein
MKRNHYDIPEERWLPDGVYTFSEEDNIEILSKDISVKGLGQDSDVDSFMEKYPDWVVASAYETLHTFFLSKRPNKFDGLEFGSGFNYGSTNLLCGLPASVNYVLILAEND